MPPDELWGCVKMLFEILDAKEESSNGRVFSPTYISSCRVWDTHRLKRILPKMKIFARIAECERWIEDNPGKFDGIADRRQEIQLLLLDLDKLTKK